MSVAYQYGVETTAQPAASANVSAPDELCSLFAYGVTKTSVAASRSASSSMSRKRSSSYDVLGEVEVDDAPLQHQAVLLASAPRDLRMCAAGDHVEDVGMLLDDRRQRVEHHLDSLAGREQAERREQEPRLDARVAAVGGCHVAGPTTGVELAARASELDRRTVRDDVDLLVRAGAHLAEHPAAGLGHHDHALRFVAERGQHLELVTRRLGQDRVQRHDERLRELAGEREHVLPVATAVDPVLVLQQHDVDIRARERPRSADVVAARALGRGAQDLGPLRARGLVDHDELDDVVDAGDVEQSSPDIEGESADPARAGWERREDRGTHVCAPLSPEARGLRERTQAGSAGRQPSRFRPPAAVAPFDPKGGSASPETGR